MHFEKEPMIMNGTYYLPLPIDLVKYLGIEEKTKLIIQDEQGKHGKYISVWITKKK